MVTVIHKNTRNAAGTSEDVVHPWLRSKILSFETDIMKRRFLESYGNVVNS